MIKDHFIENNNLYNGTHLFIQADCIEHESCLHTTDHNFTRSLYISVDKTDQNHSQQDVVLSVWDLNVCHSSVQMMQLLHWRRYSLERLGSKLHRKSLCHASHEKPQNLPLPEWLHLNPWQAIVLLWKKPQSWTPALSWTLLLSKRVYSLSFLSCVFTLLES